MPTRTPACDITSALNSCVEPAVREVDNQTSIVPSPSHLHLMDLPQELQDMIFDYAYHRARQSEIIPRGDWAVSQFRKQRFGATDGYIIKAYPGPRVSDFMVSKRYFVAAARAYVSSQPVCFTVQQGDDLTGEPFWTDGVIAEFARNVNANLFTLPFLFRMVNMKTLSLNLKVFHICCDEEQTLPIFDRELTQSELSRLRPAKFAARWVGDASKFRIVATDVDGYNATEEQRTMFDTNIRLLQDFVRAQMLSQKSNVTLVNDLGPESFTPIYTGSQVGFESSAMRGTPRRRDLVNGLSLLSRHFMASGQPPLIESTVVELLDISLHKGATTGIDGGDEGVAAQMVSPRAQAEEKICVVERRLRKAQRASILFAFGFSLLLIWLGVELELPNHPREMCRAF